MGVIIIEIKTSDILSIIALIITSVGKARQPHPLSRTRSHRQTHRTRRQAVRT